MAYGSPRLQPEPPPSTLAAIAGALALVFISGAVLVWVAVGTEGFRSEPLPSAVAVLPSARSDSPAPAETPAPEEPATQQPADVLTPVPTASAAPASVSPTRPARTTPPLGTPPPPRSGRGGIEFGTTLRGGEIVDARTLFALSDTLVIRAALLDEAGPLPLVLEVVSDPRRELVHRELVPVDDADLAELTRELRLRSAVEAAGYYVVRVVRDGVELASGQLLITD